MDLVETFRISWRNVKGHPLRSFLTTLGVVIGVAAVITFVTLGAGLQADIIRTIAGDNAEVVYVSTETGSDAGLPSLGGGRPVFTTHDVRQIRRLEGVAAAAPLDGIPTTRIVHDNNSVPFKRVTVTTPSYFPIKGYDVVAGRLYHTGQHEVVLNREAATQFPRNVSVGDEITFVRAANDNQVNATVVGIVKEPSSESGSSLLVGRGSQPAVYAPPVPLYHGTAVSPTQGEEQRVYRRIIVEAKSLDAVDDVRGRILAYLAERSDARRLTPPGYEFDVTTYDQLVDQIRDVSGTFTAYITGIAVISLLVGAIGIANIMLVSVAERTREIGIMKALGAQNRDVLQLFLLEAVMLGLIGAVTGVVAGAVGGYLGTSLIDLPLVYRPVWFVAAIGVGLLVGVIAGLYPAWSAASTDPIEALRYE